MAEARRKAVHPPAPEPLPRPVVDSHCHIDMRGGDEDALTARQSVERAAAVNVTGIVQVGCSIRDVADAVEMAEARLRAAFPGIEISRSTAAPAGAAPPA